MTDDVADLIRRLEACGWQFLGEGSSSSGAFGFRTIYVVYRPQRLGKPQRFRKTVAGLRTLVRNLEAKQLHVYEAQRRKRVGGGS